MAPQMRAGEPGARPLRSVDDAERKIAESLPWSPLDFVKGLSKTGDRQVLARALARQIDIANDLRIVYSVSPALDVLVCTERLPWDSSFFGYEVARLHGVYPLTPGGYDPDADYVPALRAGVHAAASRGIRYLFGVIDARDLPTIRALTSLGFALIETRLYYHLDLRTFTYPRRFSCRPATAADVDCLTELAQAATNRYDRFNADPFIGRDEARRFIARWIRASIVEGLADVTMIPASPRPNALCTVKYHANNEEAWGTSIAQLVLALASTVGSRFVGVIAETNYLLKERGIEHLFYTTQLANHSIARVGQHLGFRVQRGEYVFRLLL